MLKEMNFQLKILQGEGKKKGFQEDGRVGGTGNLSPQLDDNYTS